MSQSPENSVDWRAGYEAALAPTGLGIRQREDLGILELTGRDRQSFLQGMVSNDVAALTPGQGCHAVFLDSTAHLLADLFVHCLSDRLLVETDRRCLDRLAQTLDKYLIMEKVRIQDVTAEWRVISLIGSGTDAVREALLAPGRFAAAHRHSLVSGFDLWLPRAEESSTAAGLTQIGAVPVDAQAWETLRVEAGIPAWGAELDETVLLPEAGLEGAVSYTKGCYLGQEIVARIAARGHTNRALRAVVLAEGEAVPHPGDTVHLPEDGPDAGREIGRITSAVRSPRWENRALALAYLRREHFEPGTAVAVHLRQPNGAVFAASAEVRMPGA